MLKLITHHRGKHTDSLKFELHSDYRQDSGTVECTFNRPTLRVMAKALASPKNMVEACKVGTHLEETIPDEYMIDVE